MSRNPWLNKTSKLSIIVPVFNEAPQLVENLDLLLAEVEDYFPNFEVIVIDDRSGDRTAPIVEAMNPAAWPSV